MGVNSKVGMQGDMDEVSKYHQEKMLSNPSSPAGDAGNPAVDKASGSAFGLNPGNMGNPMMPMSGGKPVPGGMGELDSKNPMMDASSGGRESTLPSEGDVMATNPQGHKQAPLAGKLYQASAAHQKASKG